MRSTSTDLLGPVREIALLPQGARNHSTVHDGGRKGASAGPIASTFARKRSSAIPAGCCTSTASWVVHARSASEAGGFAQRGLDADVNGGAEEVRQKVGNLFESGGRKGRSFVAHDVGVEVSRADRQRGKFAAPDFDRRHLTPALNGRAVVAR
jgi:hypothetical protein